MQVYNSDNNQVFFEHQDLLPALFSLRGLNRSATYIELSKNDFVEILREANVLIKPKPKTKEEEKKDKDGSKKAVAQV